MNSGLFPLPFLHRCLTSASPQMFILSLAWEIPALNLSPSSEEETSSERRKEVGERGKHSQHQCLAWVSTHVFGRVNSESQRSVSTFWVPVCPVLCPFRGGSKLQGRALPREAGRVRRAGRGEHHGSLTRTR